MKRALLIGIDDYDHFSNLSGCANDVNALLPLLARNEDSSINFECQPLTSRSGRVTRAVLIDSLRALWAPGADVGLLYFAGHGRVDVGDLGLVTQDGNDRDDGIPVSRILTEIQQSTIGEAIVILDCCFSGTAGTVPQLGSHLAAIRRGVTVLTSSRHDQEAEEITTGQGVFSMYLCGALDGGASDILGKVTMAGVYAYLSESFGAWEQRPAFKANVDRLHELRQCKSAVPLKDLRRLSEFFPDANSELPLDPSFEPTAEPRDAEHEAVFAILQKCRAAKLVEPVGAEHMYFAAMENKPCRLTPLGKHYWRLAKEDRL